MKSCQVTHLKATKRIILLICVACILVCFWSLQSRCYIFNEEQNISDLVYLKDLHLNGSDHIEMSKFSGVPFAYPTRVDFRIIILTFSRSRSLQILLDSLHDIQLDGHTGAVEIWIDVDKKSRINKDVLSTAENFSWRIGPATIHIQAEHVGIYGQWIDTWRPRTSDRDVRQEIALILEDDMTVSPFVYRWLRAVHDRYGGRRDFAGASLNSGEQMTAHNNGARIEVDDPVFMYVCIGTWGFSPSPRVWIDFQDWYHAKSRQPSFHPYVNGTLPSQWYADFELVGREDTMWEMWFIFYADERSLLTVYYNVVNSTAPTSKCPWNIPNILCGHFLEQLDNRMCFGFNRQEIGLHQDINSSKFATCPMVKEWSDSYIDFPDELQKFDWWGRKIEV